MTTLQPNEIRSLLERFYNGDDGIISSITIHYPRSGPTEITIIVSVMDRDSVGDERWVNLKLELHDVQEFTFREQLHATYVVMTDGLHINYFDGVFFVDLGDVWQEHPQTAEEYRSSAVYAAAKVVMWNALPWEQ